MLDYNKLNYLLDHHDPLGLIAKGAPGFEYKGVALSVLEELRYGAVTKPMLIKSLENGFIDWFNKLPDKDLDSLATAILQT